MELAQQRHHVVQVAVDAAGHAGILHLHRHVAALKAGPVHLADGGAGQRLQVDLLKEAAPVLAQLLDHVWGTNAYLEERTVDVHIRRLRKILDTAKLAKYIQTVRGHGYRFVVEDKQAR